MSVGERILELRKLRNMSQGQLASSLLVSRQAVSKWENDQASPDTLKLIRLAEVLDTEVEYLATGRKPVYQSPPIVVNILKKPEYNSEKIIEKPVIKRIIHTKYIRNPLEYSVIGFMCFLLGFAVGFVL